MDLPLTSFNKKKQKKVGKYSIITFDIDKPKGNKYSNFDFANVKKQLGEGSSDEEDERFHDKDALELVRRMEEKYGKKKTKSGKRMRFKEDDFIEKSIGYDLEDAFIDDTEAHDELVPSTLDTKKGGFYVNKGKLDFVSIGEGFSEVESDEEEDRTKISKKKQEEAAKETVKEALKPTPKVPKLKEKAEEVKKIGENKAKKRVAAISSSSSESEEEKEEGERRLVGGPPTLKRSKPAPPSTSAKNGKEKGEEKKKEENEKTEGERRRMTGAPPSLMKKKLIPPSDAPSSSSNAGKPPTEVNLVEVSSEDDRNSPENSSEMEGISTKMELDMAEVPKEVQQHVIQFRQLCDTYVKTGKKHLSQILVDKAIEINELTSSLGMKKSVRGQVVERLATMCNYTKHGLLSRMNSSVKVAAAPAPSSSMVDIPRDECVSIPPVVPSPIKSSTLLHDAPPVLTPAVVKAKTTPPIPASSLISLKPSALAPPVVKPSPMVAPTSAPKKSSSQTVNNWTTKEIEAAIRLYPELTTRMTEFTRTCTFQQFISSIALTNTSAAALIAPSVPSPAKSSTSIASSTSTAIPTAETYEQLKKTVLNHIPESYRTNFKELLTHNEVAPYINKAKAKLIAKYKMREKSFAFMDFSDPDLARGFELFVQLALKFFDQKPLMQLAFLENVMTHFFQEYGRADRLVRHFIPKFKELEPVRRLNEYQDIGKRMTQKENEVQHSTGSCSSAKKVGTTAASQMVDAAKLTQMMALPSTSAVQQQQENAMVAQLKKMTPQSMQALIASLQGSTPTVIAQQMQALQAVMRKQLEDETVKKAKEAEERRVTMMKVKLEEMEKKRKEKEEEMEKRRKEKEEEIEKRRKEKEEEKRKKEEEKRLEREKREEEKRLEKAKKMEEERLRRLREEELREQRRREEQERKMREEMEKKKMEEELKKKAEAIRIKQEEEKREEEERKRQEQLREEEERAALLLAEEVTMEMEEAEGIPRMLTESEEVEEKEEEERLKEREKQVVAAREAAIQRSNSMSQRVMKQEFNDKELLDSFFVGGSSSAGTVCGVESDEVSDASLSQSAMHLEHKPSMQALIQQQMAPQHQSPLMQNAMQSPQMPVRFSNGNQYGASQQQMGSGPSTPSAFGSPFQSIASPLTNHSPHINMSASPQQMNGSQQSMSRHNSLSSMSNPHANSPMQHQLQNTFFSNQLPSNGAIAHQPTLPQQQMQQMQQPQQSQQQLQQPISQMQQSMQLMQQPQQHMQQPQQRMQQMQQPLQQIQHSQQAQQQPQQQIVHQQWQPQQPMQQPQQSSLQQQNQQHMNHHQQMQMMQQRQMQLQQQQQQQLAMLLRQQEGQKRQQELKQRERAEKQRLQQVQQMQQQQMMQQRGQQMGGEGQRQQMMGQQGGTMGTHNQMVQQQQPFHQGYSGQMQQMQQQQQMSHEQQMRQMMSMNQQQNSQMAELQRNQQNQGQTHANQFF